MFFIKYRMISDLSIASRNENRPLSIILVAHPRPPETYLRALDLVSLGYDCSLSPGSIDAYGGLLLVGGGDVLPAFYRGDVPARNVNFVKDKLEFNLLHRFIGENKPGLAICRGFQLVNAFFGGSLKNVNGHMGKQDVYHPVSACGEIFGKLDRVNSAHRQAADIVPDNAKSSPSPPTSRSKRRFTAKIFSALSFTPKEWKTAATKYTNIFYRFFNC